MRVVRHVLRHKAALFVCICLLAVQACTDLALPALTSKIVDVGIQQSGVERVSPEKMDAASFETACALSSEEDARVLREAYASDGAGFYVLADGREADRGVLDGILTWPFALMAAGFASSEGADASPGAASASGGAADAVSGAASAAGASEPSSGTVFAGTASDEASLAALAEVNGSLLEQQALRTTRAVYEAAGYDMAGMQMSYLLETGAKMLALAALGMAAAVGVALVASRTGARIGYELRSRLFSRVVAFSDADVGRFSAASLITRGTNDIQLIQQVSTMLMRMVLYAPILAIGGVIMVLRTNASMGWIIVVAILAIFAVLAVVFGVALPKFKIMQKLVDRVNLVSREMLTGLPVVRAFGREQLEEERFAEASGKLMRTQLFTNRVMTLMMPAMSLIMNATSVAIVWFGSHYVDLGTIQTGDLIAFITYSMVIVMGFLMIGMIAIMLPRADVAAERIDEVLSTEPSIGDPPVPKTLETSERPNPAEASAGASEEAKALETSEAPAKHPTGARIAFEDVSFRYDDASECALSHVSFVAEPGQVLAIVGSTGSGKSTVVKLIERFYDVSEGRVTIDGVDVRELSQRELRAQLGYVPQKAFLFSGSIESNVAYGLEQAGEEAGTGRAGGPGGAVRADGSARAGGLDSARLGKAVEEALDIAQASAFVAEKEEGLGFAVSQGGTNVSGGQRQRLAIARALATGARAYLFDDSFSALDYKTDALLRQRLAHDLAGVTQIIVAQRIATVMQADRIVVLDEGCVVGRGTHAELMESCGEYREIALSQLSEQELEGGGVR